MQIWVVTGSREPESSRSCSAGRRTPLNADPWAAVHDMTPDPEIYVGLASVSVVFTGFAGISIVLTGRRPNQWRSVDSGRVWWMISLSLASAFFSLLPVVVARLIATTDSLWQICSALFLVYMVTSTIQSSLLVRRAYRLPDVDRDTPRNFILVGLVGASGMLALALDIFHVFPTRGEGLYLVALVCSLGIAARMFIRTLAVLRTSEGE